MTRLSTAFAKPHPAFAAFLTTVDDDTAAKQCGRGNKDIFTAAEKLGVEM